MQRQGGNRVGGGGNRGRQLQARQHSGKVPQVLAFFGDAKAIWARLPMHHRAQPICGSRSCSVLKSLRRDGTSSQQHLRSAPLDSNVGEALEEFVEYAEKLKRKAIGGEENLCNQMLAQRFQRVYWISLYV